MSPTATKTRIACVYRRVWADGYGARGWKLRDAIDDPEIIASTPEPGNRIPTSVFVHDVLDHLLCGLGPSGHRNEAVALGQLANRTGMDPTPDFAQIVDEDLLQGSALGERLCDLLPKELVELLPASVRDGKAVIAYLEQRIERHALRARLIERLRELGQAGASEAQAQYQRHGLAYEKRAQLGLALQHLLSEADRFVLGHSLPAAQARLVIEPARCAFEILSPVERRTHATY